MLSVVLVMMATGTAEARTIKGRIFNASDSTALVGSICRLIADGREVNTTASDVNGSFLLETDIQSEANIEIEKDGFSPVSITLSDGKKGIDIHKIYLEKSRKLNEVTVLANSETIRDGKTIVYPTSSDIKSSSTSISLFQKLPLPGLLTDPINRSLSVDGGSPMILINGVPSTMMDVNSLQPKEIIKVEYSRVTPARYADRGLTGMLSITVRRQNDGSELYAWGRSAVNTVFMDAQIRASYHQGPSQFTFSYAPSWRNYQKVFDNNTESFIANDFKVDLEAHDRAPFYYHMHDVRLKYDVTPNKKTLFSAVFNIKPYIDSSHTYSHNIDSSSGAYDNNNATRNKQLTPSLDLFLRYDFNEKNSLEAQMVGTLSSSDYRRDNTYIFPEMDSESYLIDIDGRRRSLITEVSYSHSFNYLTSFSGGLQNTISKSTNKYLSTDHTPVLTENNNYVYVRLSHRIKSIYLSLSSGVKLYWMKNDLIHRNFIRNISTAQLSWNISPCLNIQGAFQYIPSIPSLSSLTDYRQQVSPYLFYNGNPELKVADNLSYRVQGSYNIQKFTATFQSMLNDTRNCVINDIFYIGDGHFLSQAVNAKRTRNIYNTLTLQVRNIQGFGTSLNVMLAHYNSAGENWKHSLTSFSGSISLWWNKGPLTVSYWRKLPGKYLSGHIVGKEENGDALQFDYSPDKHWTFGAGWMYMFDRYGTSYPVWNRSEINPSYRERYIKNNANMIVLSVNYNANFGSIFRTAKRNLNNSDNASTILKM